MARLMQVLIQAAEKVGIVNADMAMDLDELREVRNRIHIKTVSAPEYNH